MLILDLMRRGFSYTEILGLTVPQAQMFARVGRKYDNTMRAIAINDNVVASGRVEQMAAQDYLNRLLYED